MEKLFFYDLETTGVNHWQHGVHQISGAIEIDGELKERFDYKVMPVGMIDEEALKIAGVTNDDLLHYPLPSDVYRRIIGLLSKYVDRYDKKDKFHLVGYNNAAFDNHFFRKFFDVNNDKYFGSWFWSDTIDIMVLASSSLAERRHEMENFKLSTVAKFLGIEVNENQLHDAVYDIDLTRQIYRTLHEKK